MPTSRSRSDRDQSSADDSVAGTVAGRVTEATARSEDPCVAVDQSEVDRRFAAIVGEWDLRGELAQILARRIATLSVRLERLDSPEPVAEVQRHEGHARLPLPAVQEYEAATQRQLVEVLTEFRKVQRADWVRRTTTERRPVQVVATAPVEPRVVPTGLALATPPQRPADAEPATPRDQPRAPEPRGSLPERGEFKKIVDGKSIILPNRV